MNARQLAAQRNAAQGDTRYALHEFDQAISSYTAAIQDDPDNGVSYGKRATAYYVLNKYQEAVDDLLQTIKHGQAGHTVYNMLGTAYCWLSRFEEAIAAFTRSIELSPDTTVYINRATTYLKLHDNAKALSDYDQAIALEPHNAKNRNLRAILYYRQNKFDKALEDHDAAIKFGTGGDPVLLSTFYGNRGNTYCKQRQENKAFADYSKSIEISPKMTVYHMRANIHFHRKNYKEAILDYNEAIKMDDKNIEAYKCRAACYRHTQQGALADADEEKVFQLTKLPCLKDMCKYFIFANHDKVMTSGVRHFIDHAPDAPGMTTTALKSVLTGCRITEGSIRLKQTAQGYLPGRTLFDEIRAEEDSYSRRQHEHRVEEKLEKNVRKLEKILNKLEHEEERPEEERPAKKRKLKK